MVQKQDQRIAILGGIKLFEGKDQINQEIRNGTESDK